MSSQQGDSPEALRSSWPPDIRRLVVKIGTSTLTGGARALDEARISDLARQIAAVRERGIQVILVSSGAIGVGVGRLRLEQRPRVIGALQAVAAVGQSLLMHAYEEAFHRQGIQVAQLLVTASDLADRRRYVNFTNALNALFDFDVLPIVNENDTVAVDEIRFGDNDTLSAHVTNAVEAAALVILTDTDGVFTSDPNRFSDARRFSTLDPTGPDFQALLGVRETSETTDRLGTGSLGTKLRAAEIVTASGVPMLLASGARSDVLTSILDGMDVGTLFTPRTTTTTRRKRWIADTVRPMGALVVDDGAFDAVVQHGKSLLPVGIVGVEGSFVLGDSVRCIDAGGKEFARGLVNYAADEIRRIKGQRTDSIEAILGYRYADEVVHRDNLVLLG